MAVVSLSEMMEAGAHFGHQTRRWNPKMSKYIYCARNGVHIIDLVKTALCMNNAYKWTRNAAKSGKRFLFVGTKKQASDVVAQEATRCGAAYVNQRWLGGMLTNWTTMKARIERLKDLERMESSGSIAMRPKKEAAVLRREPVSYTHLTLVFLYRQIRNVYHFLLHFLSIYKHCSYTKPFLQDQ